MTHCSFFLYHVDVHQYATYSNLDAGSLHAAIIPITSCHKIDRSKFAYAHCLPFLNIQKKCMRVKWFFTRSSIITRLGSIQCSAYWFSSMCHDLILIELKCEISVYYYNSRCGVSKDISLTSIFIYGISVTSQSLKAHQFVQQPNGSHEYS